MSRDIAADAEHIVNEEAVRRLYGTTDRNVIEAFGMALRWIDANILPVLALTMLCGLAAIGFSTFLGDVTYSWKVGISITVGAFLAIKTHNR